MHIAEGDCLKSGEATIDFTYFRMADRATSTAIASVCLAVDFIDIHTLYDTALYRAQFHVCTRMED